MEYFEIVSKSITAKQELYGNQIGMCRLDRLTVADSLSSSIFVDFGVENTEFEIIVQMITLHNLKIFIFTRLKVPLTIQYKYVQTSRLMPLLLLILFIIQISQ